MNTSNGRPEGTAASPAGEPWHAARAALGVRAEAFNLAAAVDRHAVGEAGERAALRICEVDGGASEISYRELSALTNRFANALRGLGIAPGERVYLMLGRDAAFPLALLGTLKAGAVAAPIFAAFGPEPVATRIRVGQGAVLVTTDRLYRSRVVPVLDTLPQLDTILLLAEDGGTTNVEGTLDLRQLMQAAADTAPQLLTCEADPAWLHFTSGTSGTPKAVVHAHGAALQLYASAQEVLELGADDRFWCTADPGWITSTAYGVAAPLLLGATVLVEPGGFDPQRWFATLAREAVSVWYTTPTALRLLMRAWPDEAEPLRLPALRVVASVGEPLNAEAAQWGLRVLGRPVRDSWWQTETGAIMLAATPASGLRPGSMGRPLAGVRAEVVRRLAGGRIEVLPAGEAEGELALAAGWPAMFHDYLGQTLRYQACFAAGLYLSGDLVRRDAAGDYWFVGRADDAIKSAGHLIGPFEVERVLMAHPAVAEAAAIGVPDETTGERVRVLVTLRPGAAPSEALASELRGHARARLGATIAPKEILFAAHLPHTRSGKIMRRLVKARELGLPAGDLSMLEEEPVDDDDDDAR